MSSSRSKPLHEYPAATAGGTVLSHYGVDSAQFNALNWIADDVVLVPAGKFLLYINVRTGQVDSDEGPSAGGVGTVAVHPSRRYYVVGERNPESPRLLVYEWPSRKQVGQFNGSGCSVGYAASCFDREGTRVATVGSAPDYTLAVWDWETRSMSLRNKCFSSDVYTVCFSSFDNSLLVTGGSGHIKFWSMAETFTGLKLQGTLGKFGRLEISNISGFVVLPDGKVLSGSSNGSLLLWEGDLVKCSFVHSVPEVDGEAMVPCHNGAINAVALVHDAHTVVTFGDDGWIRYWNREELELAEGEGVPAMYAPHCLSEVCVDAHAKLRSVTLRNTTDGRQEWVLLDSRGGITTSIMLSREEVSNAHSGDPTGVAPSVSQANARIHFNGGGITCSAASPVAHFVVTGGEDGVVRLLDYTSGEELTHIDWPHQRHNGSAAPGDVDEEFRDAAVVRGEREMGSTSRAVPVTTIAFFAQDPSHTHLIAGFGDGTLRLLLLSLTPHPRFTLLGQWRPHTSDVFATVLDTQERTLCTVAHDGTAFFFSVSDTFDSLAPIGFCRLPLAGPTCAAWDEAGCGCFVGFSSGQLLSIRTPHPDDVDHARSFEFACEYALIGIRQRRLPPPAPADEQDAQGEEEDMLEERDEGPWAISLVCRVPSPDGGHAIAVGMSKEELLYVYKATVRYPNVVTLPPLPPTGVEPPNYVEDPGDNLCHRDLLPRRAFMSASGRQLLVVCDGARVLVREAPEAARLCTDDSTVTVALMTPAHDSTRGTITSAQMSFDSSVVITTGTDGLVVAQLRPGCQPPIRRTEVKASPQSQTTTGETSADTALPDEALPVALSIQQQKEADDAARARAEKEARQQEFLAKVFALQERFAALKATNAALPESARLSEEALQSDNTLQARLAAEKERRVAQARQEYAVDSAREALRTAKLRRCFVDNLLYDRFLVRAFRGGFSVASFRTTDPSAAISRLEREIASLAMSDGDSSDEDDGGQAGARGAAEEDPEMCTEQAPSTSHPGPQATQADDTTHHTTLAGTGNGQDALGRPQPAIASGTAAAELAAQTTRIKMSATVKQQLQKADERREERQTRRNGYDALLATAPDPKEDEALLAEMERRDIEERGECVLRTDPKYRGRKDFRPTASAKLQRMIALERLLVDKKSKFNEQLTAARERKRQVLQTLNSIQAKIREMNKELGEEHGEDEEMTMLSDEEPEKAFSITRAGLDAFAKRKAMDRLKEEEAKKAQRGFGADLAAAPQSQHRASTESKPVSDADAASTSRRETLGTRNGESTSKGSRNTSRLTRGSRQSTMFLSAANRDRMEAEMRAKLESIKLSEMEEEERAMRREQLTCERQRLMSQAEDIMCAFDDNLYDLFRQHADVDADLCLGDVHLLLLFREYQMLLVFRNQDRDLRQQLRGAKASRDATRKNIVTLQENVQEYDNTLAVLQDKLKQHKRDAEAYIQESCPADRVAYLLKIFNRHIKRKKNLDDGEDNDDITSDDEDEDIDDGDSDIGEELCPPNCDPAVWERTLALREERLDYSDAITEKRKKREDTGRRLEQCNKELAGVTTSVAECLARIEELDHEKRHQLNLLSVVAPLRCSQVRCLSTDEGTVPAALWDRDVLVLPEEELQRLATRVVELAAQKEERRGEIASMAAELQRLQAERADVQRVHSHWEGQVHEVMMLKFGRHVDLEMLESCGTSRRIETKKEELRRTELHWDREVRKRENRIAALRDELQRRLLHNTHLLQDLGDYEGERQLAERTLAKASSGAVHKFRGTKVATRADRANLRELISAQQVEMDALNAEIFMLRRKGGHAYSPAAATY